MHFVTMLTSICFVQRNFTGYLLKLCTGSVTIYWFAVWFVY